MAGGVRLGIGYTVLVIGLALGLVGGVLSGFNFHFTASETNCHDHVLGGQHCETDEASMDGEVLGTWLMLPGMLLVVAAIPMVATGHTARDREREERRGAPRSEPRS